MKPNTLQHTPLDEADDLIETADFPPEERARAASRSTWVSVGVNVVLSTAQILAGVFAHSQALIADGIHSLSDLLSDFVVLLARRQSNKAADIDHPYGHQRFETEIGRAHV